MCGRQDYWLWELVYISKREHADDEGLPSDLLDKARCCMGVGKEHSESARGEKVTLWSEMSMRQLSF